MLKKILVTGSNGQVGRCLVERLSSRDDIELLAVDREQLDITNQVSVHEVVSKFRPDFIINAAAHTAVDKAEEEVELSYAINEQGPKFLAEAANYIDAAILHISTDYVFEGNKEGEHQETDMTNPQGVYGKSKLAGEVAVAEACTKHIILRTAWVFSEHGNNFVKTMLSLAHSKSEIQIVCDQLGGPTYAGDIADTLVRIINCYENEKQSGIYHYSGYPYVSWHEFAFEIFEATKKTSFLGNVPILIPSNSSEYLTRAVRPKNSMLDCQKISKVFKIEPSNWKSKLYHVINNVCLGDNQ